MRSLARASRASRDGPMSFHLVPVELALEVPAERAFGVGDLGVGRMHREAELFDQRSALGAEFAMGLIPGGTSRERGHHQVWAFGSVMKWASSSSYGFTSRNVAPGNLRSASSAWAMASAAVNAFRRRTRIPGVPAIEAWRKSAKQRKFCTTILYDTPQTLHETVPNCQPVTDQAVFPGEAHRTSGRHGRAFAENRPRRS